MDKKITQNQLLDSKMIALEKKQKKDFDELKFQFDTTYQELRPSRLLHRAFEDIKEEPKIKNNVFEGLLSIVGGFLSKKLFVGKSNSTFKNLLGYTIQYITSSFISKKL